MTAPTDDDDAAAIAAAARVAEITALYQQMRQTLQLWMADCGDPSSRTTKVQLKKMDDIQYAHVLVLKAEEAFHDRQKSGSIAQAIIDLDEIRAEIGRRLDSLRDAAAESGFSGGADTGGGGGAS